MGGKGSAERREYLPPKEMELIKEGTSEMMKRLVEQGAEAGWDPTKIFSDALVGFHTHTGDDKDTFNKYFNKINEILSERDIGLSPYFVEGCLEKAMKAAEYGSDLVILSGDYDTTGLEITSRDSNGRISYSMIDGSGQKHVFETFPFRKNVLIDNEKPLNDIADIIERNYYDNRIIS